MKCSLSKLLHHVQNPKALVRLINPVSLQCFSYYAFVLLFIFKSDTLIFTPIAFIKGVTMNKLRRVPEYRIIPERKILLLTIWTLLHITMPIGCKLFLPSIIRSLFPILNYKSSPRFLNAFSYSHSKILSR